MFVFNTPIRPKGPANYSDARALRLYYIVLYYIVLLYYLELYCIILNYINRFAHSAGPCPMGQ